MQKEQKQNSKIKYPWEGEQWVRKSGDRGFFVLRLSILFFLNAHMF